jgi:hypothetical protein
MIGSGSDGSFATIGIQSGEEGVQISFAGSEQIISGVCYHLYPNTSDCNQYFVEKFSCSDTVLLAAICPAGQYLGSNFLCLECEANTYQTGVGMVAIDACISCGPGKFTFTSGASAESSCVTLNNSASTRESQYLAQKDRISSIRLPNLSTSVPKKVDEFQDRFNPS